jgi:hypothetical protein
VFINLPNKGLLGSVLQFMPTIDSAKVSLIAKDILASISIIDDQLKRLENEGLHPFSPEANEVIMRVEKEMPVLFKKICDHFERNPEEHRAAFQQQFTYPSRFKTHASLEYILTYNYLILDKLQSSDFLLCNFFSDPDHCAYAENMMRANKQKVKPYVRMT